MHPDENLIIKMSSAAVRKTGAAHLKTIFKFINILQSSLSNSPDYNI